jgi:hypothetical protein
MARIGAPAYLPGMSKFPDDQDGYLVAHLSDGDAVWQSTVISAVSHEEAALLAVGDRTYG